MRLARLGVTRVAPLCSDTTRTGSIVNGSAQYLENMVTMMLQTMSSLVWSVAVMSMKTFLVSSVILERSLLMMGGREQTFRSASRMTGYTGLSRRMCRYLPRCLSVS